MKKISIGLVTCLLVQPVLAEKSGAVLAIHSAAASMALLSKMASDLMWVAAKGTSKNSHGGSGRKSAKKEDAPGSPKSNNHALNPNNGASSAGSGGGNGGQPPNNPNNGATSDGGSSSMTTAQLIELMRNLLQQMHNNAGNEAVLVGLLTRAEQVMTDYNNNPFVRYGWFLSNGYGEMQRLLQEARTIREAAHARPEGRLTEFERRLGQNEEQVHEARIIAAAASAAATSSTRAPVQQQPADDDLLPELDNNGDDI